VSLLTCKRALHEFEYGALPLRQPAWYQPVSALRVSENGRKNTETLCGLNAVLMLKHRHHHHHLPDLCVQS
jgi:hypothetical protein